MYDKCPFQAASYTSELFNGIDSFETVEMSIQSSSGCCDNGTHGDRQQETVTVTAIVLPAALRPAMNVAPKSSIRRTAGLLLPNLIYELRCGVSQVSML